MSVSPLESKFALGVLLPTLKEIDDLGLIVLEQGEKILTDLEVLSEGKL